MLNDNLFSSSVRHKHIDFLLNMITQSQQLHVQLVSVGIQVSIQLSSKTDYTVVIAFFALSLDTMMSTLDEPT